MQNARPKRNNRRGDFAGDVKAAEGERLITGARANRQVQALQRRTVAPGAFGNTHQPLGVQMLRQAQLRQNLVGQIIVD